MNIIKKCQPLSFDKQRSITNRDTPGPGAYDIALPLVRPNYQAIRKSNDVIILKINHKGESCNFRSQQDRFPNQKEKSPGPAQYNNSNSDAPKKVSHPRYSQRYSDLIDFMYKFKPKIPAIPDYQVHYNKQQELNMRKIKNSQRRNKQSYFQTKIKSINKKESSISTQHIKNISLTYRKNSENQNTAVNLLENKQMKTIDFPEQSSRVRQAKSSMQRQSQMLFNRISLYNRGMLGVLLAKSKEKKKQKSIDYRMVKLSSQNNSHNTDQNQKINQQF